MNELETKNGQLLINPKYGSLGQGNGLPRQPTNNQEKWGGKL